MPLFYTDMIHMWVLHHDCKQQITSGLGVFAWFKHILLQNAITGLAQAILIYERAAPHNIITLPLCLVDCRLHADGYKEGFEKGQQRGMVEGFQMGVREGSKIGSEVSV